MLFRTVVQGHVVQGLVEGLQFVSWQQALVQPVAEDSSADNSAKNHNYLLPPAPPGGNI